MLYLYLQQLQNQKQDEKILDSVSELKSISKRMNEMLMTVGKNVIKDGSYDEVIFNQNKIVIEFFVEQFCDNINFKGDVTIPIEVSKKAFEILKKTILNPENVKAIISEPDWDKGWKDVKDLENEFKKELLTLDTRLQIEKFYYYKIYQNYANKILPIIENDSRLLEYFDNKLFESYELEISGLPF